jgi:tetratricopeptide (TPR) repeat protein
MNSLFNLRFLLSFACIFLFAFCGFGQAATEPDFGDYSSETLTTKAWEALNVKNYKLVLAYTKECLENYENEALAMQAKLKALAPAETAAELWALNDVGTCLFIQGQAHEGLKKLNLALQDYKKLVTKFSYAQAWDTQGWFWRVSDAAKQRISVLEFDVL